MKKITLIIEDDYSDVLSITSLATRGNVTNVNVVAVKIDDGDIIHIPAEMEVRTNENY